MRTKHHGKIEIDRGWHACGSGRANTMTEEGWKAFDGSLNKARAHLEAAWSLRPNQSYAAGGKITVAIDSEGFSAESDVETGPLAVPSKSQNE